MHVLVCICSNVEAVLTAMPSTALIQAHCALIGRGRGGEVPRWGGLRATHNNHMHTSRGDVCLGRVWGSCWWLL